MEILIGLVVLAFAAMILRALLPTLIGIGRGLLGLVLFLGGLALGVSVGLSIFDRGGEYAGLLGFVVGGLIVWVGYASGHRVAGLKVSPPQEVSYSGGRGRGDSHRPEQYRPCLNCGGGRTVVCGGCHGAPGSACITCHGMVTVRCPVCG